jgi:subtilisin family serine protease
MGIRDRPTAPPIAMADGHMERLIGSIRRECLDHVVVFGDRHLRHMLLSYPPAFSRRPFFARNRGVLNPSALLSNDVVDLHRCIVSVYETINGVRINKGQLPDPDLDPAIGKDARTALITQHRENAFQDDFGHGTHVAGIIAGQAPKDESKRSVLERRYKVDQNGFKQEETFSPRCVPNDATIRGVAPRSKIVSLKVLNEEGKGRTSDIIQALEYISERVNDNPKLLKIHGINLSVGYEFDPEMFACGYSPLCSCVDRLVQNGVVVVTAAGNTGYGSSAADVGSTKIGFLNTINDPGNAALAITAGSTHRDSLHMYGVSYFSSKGPATEE